MEQRTALKAMADNQPRQVASESSGLKTRGLKAPKVYSIEIPTAGSQGIENAPPKQEKTSAQKRTSVADDSAKPAKKQQTEKKVASRVESKSVKEVKPASSSKPSAAVGQKRVAANAAPARPAKAAKASAETSRPIKPVTSRAAVKAAPVAPTNMAELRKIHAETSKKYSQSENQIKELKEQLEFEGGENTRLQRKKDSLETQLQTLERRYNSLKEEAEDSKKEFQSQIVALKEEISNTKAALTASEYKRESLVATVAHQEIAMSEQQHKIVSLSTQLDQSKATCAAQSNTIQQQSEQIGAHQKTIDTLEEKSRIEEQLRRQLHNTIQELKGNIRVYCRLRPPLPSELSSMEAPTADIHEIYQFPENTDKKNIEVIAPPELSVDGTKSNSRSWSFSFDRVFRPHETQNDVFDEISQLVQSAMDGYKVCIFAYGQTGSGKTFTMEGPPRHQASEATMGMIPRSMQQIFKVADSLKSRGWNYQFEAMFLEIYNEQINDLLESSPSATKSDDSRHEIKLVKNGGTTGKANVVEVSNMTIVPVTCPSDLYTLLDKASQNRAVAATACNERSSRSHSVFQLRLSGVNTLTGQKTYGVLNLVDLAGSERLKVSNAQGDRLKETQAINKSLSCLGDVIAALANNEKHIPYRNSKLTYLLQNCFGGDCKTLMFVNMSPLAEHVQESLCSLRFASKVNACQIGTARKQVKV